MVMTVMNDDDDEKKKENQHKLCGILYKYN